MADTLNKEIYCSDACGWCCTSLRYFITFRKNPEPGRIVLYEPVWREFSSPIGLSQDNGVDVSIHFCPFCGKAFPEELEDKWVETLMNELGIIRKENEPYEEFKKRVPPEFQSDEWWRKRGL
ncbi:MAG: hypothetical protein LBF56_02620 [Holosporales bacterium]|jgi:hypothetical protein|nr:hypothetical protein [Holosporales bacterium]